jgi:hypothetical protein
VYVTKVVDIFARIPEQLSLYFSDFPTIVKRIYKFTGKSENTKTQIAKGPLELS